MTKYRYSYAVVRTDSGVRRDIATGFSTKAEAEGLAVAATNNVPGREFVVKQRRALNPEYFDLESNASRQHYIDTGSYLVREDSANVTA